MKVPRTDGGRKRRISLRPRAASAGAGKPVLAFRLSKRQRRWLKRARPHLRRLRGSVAVEAIDGVGNTSAEAKRIKIKI
jgi:hypothetical protein